MQFLVCCWLIRLGYFFTPSAPFREACSHIVADATTPAAKKEVACSTAAAYAAFVREKNIFVSVPADCGESSNVFKYVVCILVSDIYSILQMSAKLHVVIHYLVLCNKCYVNVDLNCYVIM